VAVKVLLAAWLKSGNAETEADHLAAVESTEHLPTDFVGDNKQTQRQQLDIFEPPDLALQPDDLGEFIKLYELPYLELIGLHPGLLKAMAPGTCEDIVSLGGKMLSQSKDYGFHSRYERPITMATGSVVRLRAFRAGAENLVDGPMERRFQIAFELRRYKMGVRAENRV